MHSRLPLQGSATRGQVTLGLAALLLISSAMAADSPSPEAIASFLSSDSKNSEKLVAEQISARIDFLDLSYVDPDREGNNGGWLVGYQKTWDDSKIFVGDEAGRFVMRATSYALDVQGTYATGNTANNQDLSTIMAKLSLQRGDWGSLKTITKETSEAFMQCLYELPPDPKKDAPAEEQAAFKREEDACWVEHGIDQVVRNRDSAYLLNLDFYGGFEADHDYTETHGLFGLSAVGAFMPNKAGSIYNVFDLPFRWMRKSFSNDSTFIAPFPSARLTVERIDAGSDEIRGELTDKEKFTRASAELSFQTQLASIDGAPIKFSTSYRYFYEFDAPDAIADAALDGYDYFRASIHIPARVVPYFGSDEYHFFVRYTSGQLPFDLQSEKAVEVGFTTNFEPLAKLLTN